MDEAYRRVAKVPRTKKTSIHPQPRYADHLRPAAAACLQEALTSSLVKLNWPCLPYGGLSYGVSDCSRSQALTSLGAGSSADAQPKYSGEGDSPGVEMRSRTAGGAMVGGRRGDEDLLGRGGGNKGVERLGDLLSVYERNGEHEVDDQSSSR